MSEKSLIKHNIGKCLRMCLMMLAVWFFISGKLIEDLNMMLIGTFLMYLSGVVYGLEQIRRRSVILFFYLAFFVFLLSRPMISLIRGNVWWYYGKDGTTFALNAIFLSLTFIYLGCTVTDRILSDKGCFKKEHTLDFFDTQQTKNDFNLALNRISAIGYYICLVFSLVAGAEKVIFMLGRDYSDFYVEFSTSLPFIIQAFGVFMPYFLCVYLATMPEKTAAFTALVLYVFSTFPTLIIGARNSTVLAVLFSWLYFIIRDYLSGTHKWIGNFERTCIAAAIPLVLMFLGYYNYARDDQSFTAGGPISLVVDFFYKQGVSFDVMTRAYDAFELLPDEVPKCYTFGGFIDYFGHNMFTRELFGAVSLGEGNNVIKAVYGNSFAHSFAYVAEPNYLSGHGMGSSYILETFADFGYSGVAVYSFIISIFMTCVPLLFKKGVFSRIFILNCLTAFFLIPRAEATGWLNFIVYVQFWVVIVFCYFVAAMFKRDLTPKSAMYYIERRKITNV